MLLRSKFIKQREIKIKFGQDESKIVKDETYSILINPQIVDISKKNDEICESKEIMKDNNYLKIDIANPVSNISSRKGSFFKV